MIDFSNGIEAWLRQMSADAVTNAIVFLLLAVFLLTLWLRWRGDVPGFVHYAPNLMTTLGILGTFMGIVIGLLGFDVNDIDGSMGPLLEGLKTAFITSLAGMTLAIAFKSIDSSGKFIKPVENVDVQHVGPEDIYAEMRAQREALDKVARAISGDEDSTLVTQIQKLRSQNHDDAKEMTSLLNTQSELQASLSRASTLQAERFESFTHDLWKKLDDFAEMLSKSATEQVINALKEVISDFNRNLTEQFGDNFKQLNAAVEKLVDWQDKYREQLGQMIDQYTQGVQAITQTETSVAHISEESKQIPVTMGELKTVLETTQHQLNELERHLVAFRDMRDRAVEAVPQIQAQMDAMVKDVSTAVIEAVPQMQAQMSAMVNDVNTAVKDAGEQIMSASQAVNLAIVTGAQEFQDQVHRTNEGLTTASDQLATNSERIREQLEDTVDEINSHVRNMLAEITDNSKVIGETLVSANRDLGTNIKEVQFQVTDAVESMQKRLESTIEEVVQAQSKALARAFEIFEGELSKAASATGGAVTKQLEAMDDAMQQELERVINAMGQSLGAISNRFTEDYSKLTGEMSQIVQQVRRVDARAGVSA